MLPGMPLELCNSQVFKLASDKLGKFLYFDNQSLKGSNKKMVVLLIKLDIGKGLIPKIEIIMRKNYFIQTMDYLRLPFGCIHYRNVDHMLIISPINFPNLTFHPKPMFQFHISKPKGLCSYPNTKLLSKTKNEVKNDKLKGINSLFSSSNDSLSSYFNPISNKVYQQSQDLQLD